ncbi:serpin family protein [Rugosimonospora africana]|uniref:Serine protease inhibitor n=1 Tax=Rugosimonospora africana TaxID=556532 RepID=A0A8J3QTF0_9ACTN|nr:serpin family protein [Rugosimonospora africana]GIH15308.1 serine protease inhibitor [Rugosimonospora africana]
MTHSPLVSRRSLLLTAAALAATPLVACGRDEPVGPDGDAGLIVAKGVARARPAADAPTTDLATAVGRFGHALGAMREDPGGNWVVSPLSIACAFAMARVGAGGTTASQLDATFGFPRSGRDEAFNAITRQLVTAEVPPASAQRTRSAGTTAPPPVVCLGNALFPQLGLSLGNAFLATLAAQFGAGARPVDYTSPKAVQTINDWASRQTAGRIKKVFDHLDPNTQLVLANTVYLKASWANASPDAVAVQRPFSATAGSVSVPMFAQEGTMAYGHGSGWEAVEVPYAGGDIAMRVILAPAGGNPMDQLAPDRMAAIGRTLTPTRVEVTMPRWDYATDLDLKACLKSMGLTAPFAGDADFNGIHPGLYIDQAIHRANITVDEWGTEAAAVTAIAMPAGARVPESVINVTVNRPFAFAIVGGPQRVPLFMGVVTDPTG